MNLQTILKAIRTDMGLSQEDFANKIGIKRSNYSHVELGRSNLSVEQLNDFAKSFSINMSVLFEMLNSDDELLDVLLPKLFTDTVSVDHATKKEVEHAKEENVLLLNDPLQGFGNVNFNIVSIPIIDVSAAAGSGYFNPDHPEQLGEVKLPVNMLRSRYGNYYCGFVNGESMAPTLLHHDYIIFRLLRFDEMIDVKDNNIYFIVDRSGTSCVKRIKNRLKEENCIVCMSDNIDKANFRDFTIESEDIAHLYHVEWRFSKDMTNVNNTLFARVDELENKFDKLISTKRK